MALKLRLIKELGTVIAAYILARVRFALRRIAPLSRADHWWVSLAALVVGVLAGVGGAQWTTSEFPATDDLSQTSTAAAIAGVQNAYEPAIANPQTSTFANSSVNPENFDNRIGRQGEAGTDSDDLAETPPSIDGAVKSCWPMACLYRSLRFGEEYLPVSALLVDKT